MAVHVMSFPLRHGAAVITGATQGIGHELALRLADEGIVIGRDARQIDIVQRLFPVNSWGVFRRAFSMSGST
jgi:hypothetical protein